MKTLNLFNDDQDQQRAKSAEELLTEAARALAEHCGKDYASVKLEVTLSRGGVKASWKGYAADRTMSKDCGTLPELMEWVTPWGDESQWDIYNNQKAERERLAKALHAD